MYLMFVVMRLEKLQLESPNWVVWFSPNRRFSKPYRDLICSRGVGNWPERGPKPCPLRHSCHYGQRRIIHHLRCPLQLFYYYIAMDERITAPALILRNNTPSGWAYLALVLVYFLSHFPESPGKKSEARNKPCHRPLFYITSCFKRWRSLDL